jgi:hypothetical protein
MAQVTLCDWDDCQNTALLSVGLSPNSDETSFAGWGGHSYDACEEHFDKPLKRWVQQWDRWLEAEKETTTTWAEKDAS